MIDVKESPEKLAVFALADATQKYMTENKELYSSIATKIVESLYHIFFEEHVAIIGINHRLKSSESLKEKIIRKKLYKGSETPNDVLDKMSDIIGIMIECEFMSDEQKLFSVIKAHFNTVDQNGLFYNKQTPNIFINLKMSQPVKQKNGNEIYKIDCLYLNDEIKINFEVQIKSLVNSFWCEVEHNIVYKNNNYIPTDNYIKEMLSSVRINLLGLDKILQLVNDRINALTEYNIVKGVEFNSSIAKQFVSDLFNAKMIESIGFTVEIKKVRDMLSWYIMNKVNIMPESEKLLAFYRFQDQFRDLHKRNMRFDNEINLETDFYCEDIFSQTLGNDLLMLMNKDFEWHTFFAMLFELESEMSKIDCFKNFITILKNLFCNISLFECLYNKLSLDEANTIYEEIQVFTADALCNLNTNGMLQIEIYKKGLQDLNGFLQYNLNCIDDFNIWISKRRAIQSVINQSLQKPLL